jgi:glycine/D-amino acid oxidase-like deaminating enzyme
MSPKKDVVIIGAGVIGCSVAYHLGKRGIASHIVERESIGARASGKAWAVIPYPPFVMVEGELAEISPEKREAEPVNFFEMSEGETMANWIDLQWSSYHRMSDIARDVRERGGIDVEYGEGRNTLLFTSKQLEGSDERSLLSSFREVGAYECEWLGSDDVKATYPGLNPEFVGGINVPESQVEPYKFTLGLAQAAESMGAEVKQGEVAGFGTKGARITSVKLATGAEIQADAVVIAMGAWCQQGTSWLGKEIPVRVYMAQCLRTEVPGSLPLQTITDGEHWIIPRVNGDVVFARGTSDLIARDDFDNSLTEEAKLKIMEGVLEMVPDMEQAKLTEQRGDVLGFAPAPPFNKPVLGRLPEWENGYVAARFGGLGICMSPAAGELLADLIADGRVPVRAERMMESLSPARL